MIYKTRVVFADGTEENETWRADDVAGPAQALTAATALAKLRHGGQEHAGAWLETES